jgi:uncharacterized protein YabE (DUF348 family)
VTSRTLALTVQRVSRRLLVLLIVAALAVPVVRAANRLQMVIDGEVSHVLTFGNTVGDVLQSEGVVVTAGDEILPAPDTPLDEVSSITVLRTIEVDLVVDGRVTTHAGTFRTVQGLLDQAGVTAGDTDVLRPAPRTALADGDRVTILSPNTVQLTADGATETIETHVGTVGELLALTGTVLGEEDLLEPGRDAELVDGTSVVIQRVGYEEVTEEVALPFEEERRPTGELFTDQSRTVQSGEEGLRVDTYRLKLVDGERVERELVSEEVVREPVTRIVEYGTTERPSQSYVDDGSVWYDLARCESGLRWSYNGRFDGGLQFHPDTWTRNKPSGYPAYAYQASPQQQIEVGKVVQRRQGWGAWPTCARKLGLL